MQEAHSDSDSEREVNLDDILAAVDVSERIDILRELSANEELEPAARCRLALNLANALADRFDEEDKTSLQDLADAVLAGQKALDLADADPIAKLAALSDISTIFLTRYEVQEDEKDLKTALEYVEQSFGATSPASTSYLTRGTNFEDTLRVYSEHFGEDSYLERALQTGRACLGKQCDDPNLKAKVLSNHAICLRRRYEVHATASDVVEAIELLEKALELAKHPLTITLTTTNLVACLIDLAERGGDSSVIKLGIDTAKAAYSSTISENSSSTDSGCYDEEARALCAYNIAYLYRLQHQHCRGNDDVDILQQALAFSKDSLNYSHLSRKQKAMFLDLRGILFEMKQPSMLEDAIDCAKRAVGLVAHGDPAWAKYNNNLVEYLWKKAKNGQNVKSEMVELALLAKESFEIENAEIMVRIAAGLTRSLILMDQEEWVEASIAATDVVRLMPILARGAIFRRNQEHVLSQLTGVSQLAAALLLNAGDSPETAFQILETGRCIMSSLAISFRSPLLEYHHPGKGPLDSSIKELVSRYAMLQKYASTSTSNALVDSESVIPESVRTSRCKRILAEMDDVLGQIRALPGYSNFQSSLSSSRLIGLAGQNHIVSFIVTSARAGAFIVSSLGFDFIDLSKLSLEEVGRQVREMTGPDRATKINMRTYAGNNQRMLKVLGWLWDSAVEPVLKHLNLLSSHPRDTLPKVYWLTSGVMSLMPIHAAGYHDYGSERYTMRYVVSSYCSSTSALMRSKEQLERLAQQSTDSKSLFVAMPTTPDKGDLDLEPEQSDFIANMSSPICEIQPTSSRVRQLLPQMRNVHFNCHGQANINEPSEGHILLYNSKEDVVDPLSIEDIVDLDLTQSFLAYLSACETAEIRTFDLIDEVIHLVSAFQLVGFPHVIGTYWQAVNEVASAVSKGFYTRFGQKRRQGLKPSEDNVDIARLLHDAILEAREEDIDEPLGWAAFVHFGP